MTGRPGGVGNLEADSAYYTSRTCLRTYGVAGCTLSFCLFGTGRERTVRMKLAGRTRGPVTNTETGI